MVHGATAAWTGYTFRCAGPASLRRPARYLEQPIASRGPVRALDHIRSQRPSLFCLCAVPISPRPLADTVCRTGSRRGG